MIDRLGKFGLSNIDRESGAVAVSDDEDSDDSDLDSDYDSSSDDDEYNARGEEVLMPNRRPGETLTSLASGVLKNLSASVAKKSSAARKENPDSIARARTEISGWIEDCLCIDIVVFPGLKKENGVVVDDPIVQDIPRQLVFSFAICGQNPHSFGELVKKGLNTNGPFSDTIASVSSSSSSSHSSLKT